MPEMKTVRCVAVEYYDCNRGRIEVRIAGNTVDEYHEIRHQLIGTLPWRMRWSRIDRGVQAILYFQTEIPLSEELETRRPALELGVERVSPPDPDEIARLDWEDEMAETRTAYTEHG